nr:MAG TPA: hypothetical protein [Herelleviridae sp.]
MEKTIKTVKLELHNLETIVLDKPNVENICIYGIKNNIFNININEDDYLEFLTIDAFYIAITQPKKLTYINIFGGETTIYDILIQDTPVTHVGLVYNTGEEKWFEMSEIHINNKGNDYQKTTYNKEFDILEIHVSKINNKED